MRIVMFVHSIRSCWDHGDAHFVRGVASELLARGHTVTLYEPHDGWSAQNLVAEHGPAALYAFRASYPDLQPTLYAAEALELEQALDRADLVVVHAWTPPELVARIGQARRSAGFRLLFHDTHRCAVSDPQARAALDLAHYDGVLAFAEALRDLYLQRGWAERAWTWHEAADVRVFRPLPGEPTESDLVWIGNWGDGERAAELDEFLFAPARAAGVKGVVYGVRYPEQARARVAKAGLRYAGWLANHEAPRTFGRFRFTVQVPRRPDEAMLPGIPTIGMFEALACGIPLIVAPWQDAEQLFEAGVHYLTAQSTGEMTRKMRLLANEPGAGEAIADAGRRHVLERHTCAHRVDELLAIAASLSPRPAS